MTNEEIQAVFSLWEIVKEVATVDSTSYEDTSGEMHCPYCSGMQTQHEWLVERKPFSHEADCIVAKAQALVKQKETNNG